MTLDLDNLQNFTYALGCAAFAGRLAFNSKTPLPASPNGAKAAKALLGGYGVSPQYTTIVARGCQQKALLAAYVSAWETEQILSGGKK